MREISLVPSNSLRTFLGEATETYYLSLQGSAIVPYLKTRALSGVSAQSFKLGAVESPLPGHEIYSGMMAIPYLTRSGTVTMRFRAIPPVSFWEPFDLNTPDGLNEAREALKDWKPEGPKYRSVPGDEPRIFNPNDLCRREPFVCIAEGEFDAITANQAGLPAIGIAGVNGWRDFFARAFAGYDVVYILCDNDDKGQGLVFGEKVAAQVANSRIVLMPEGHDVNSFVMAEGPDALKARLETKK